MEESQKRKERLKAMHMGAAQGETIQSQNAPASPILVNPLGQPTFENADHLSPFSRFEYYTDPASAFQGNKRRCHTDIRPCPVNSLREPNNFAGFHAPPSSKGPKESLMSPVPPNPGYYENQSPSFRNSNLKNPVGYSPCNVSTGPKESLMTPVPPNPGFYGNQSPSFPNSHWKNPVGYSPCNGSTGYPPNSAGESSPNANFGRGTCINFPGGQGNSPGAYPGRGRQNFSGSQEASPGSYSGRGNHGNFSGRGNIGVSSGSFRGAYLGRGRHVNSPGSGNTFSGKTTSPLCGNSPGSHSKYSGSSSSTKQNYSQPPILYSKVMVLDPWDGLEPVVCDKIFSFEGLRAQSSSKSDSWLPKSIEQEKSKVCENSGSKNYSKMNLAEFLAQSFEDAVNDPSDVPAS